MQKILIIFSTALVNFIKYGSLLLFAAWTGLWWTPQLMRADKLHSLIYAAFMLILYLHTFYKYVIKAKQYHSQYHLYFYTALTSCALLGFFYGIIF